MNILKLTDKPSELEAVKDKVAEELQYLRSLDTAGDGADFLPKESNVTPLVIVNLCSLLRVVFVSLSFRHQCHQEPDKQSTVCKEGV